MQIGCVLMASGFGTRFGSNKLLAQADGVPLIQRAIAALPVSLFAKAVAVSQYDEVLAPAQQAGFIPLYNSWAAQGISASIRLGLCALREMDGVLFSVCDQPWLTEESVRRLLAGFEASPDHIVALSHAGQRGNPVLFPRSLFPELLALSGDTGGGAVIQAHPDLLCTVEAADPRELDDIDRPEDLNS